jgi:hypothetical protein
MDWDRARRQDKVARVGGLPATPDQRGAMTVDRMRPVGKKRAKQLGVCRRCLRRFAPGDYVEPFTGRTRGPGQVFQHQKGFCP